MSKLIERFLTYVKIHSASSDDYNGINPSSQCEFDLARVLEKELKEIGASGVICDEKCYVYAYLPATPGCENAPHLGLIAHMDTVPDFPGKDVKPILHENYDGSDIKLGERVLSAKDFPHLLSLKGRTLITADGTTLLGADDKAGVAEIMTLAEKLLTENIPHGYIGIAFTPDEEVGGGPDGFDLKRFNCDFGYTLDGDAEGGIEYENFNASSASVTIKGFNVHPGSSKDTMINASLVAMEFNAMLPACDTPRNTEGYEGFFHLCGIEGNIESAHMLYILRDHDASSLTAREKLMLHAAKILNERYGEGTVTVTIKQSYRNMAEKIADAMHLIENAKAACVEAGVEPIIKPIRGGTDGARLSFEGLPCPNLGTGGHAFHGPYEHITVEGMEKALEILVNIVSKYAVKA